MKSAETFWDSVAEKYAKSPIQDMEGYTKTLELTRGYLSPTDKVLEIGCGTGSTALLLAESVREIVASDLSGKMIEVGKSKARDAGISNIEFVVSDVLGEGIDNGPYEAVLAFNLLHLLEDLPASLERIHCMLKPGGFFISKTITQFGAGVPLKYRLIKLILPLMQAVGKAPYVNFMNAEVLEATIRSQGFELVETGNYPTRYIVARKT